MVYRGKFKFNFKIGRSEAKVVKEEGSITILQEVFVEGCEDFVSRIIDVHI